MEASLSTQSEINILFALEHASEIRLNRCTLLLAAIAAV
jgi:hypothetical protein